METSDGSFTWTDASSDSSKDNMVSDSHNKSKQDSHNDEDHENESHSESETVYDKQKYKERQQKKHAVYGEIENDNTNNQTNKSIKSEPSSDFDMPKTKKSTKHDENSSSSNRDDSLQEAEDYLNLRVKQEQATFVEPTPMKRKKKKKAKEEPKESEEEQILCMPFKDEIDIEEHNFDSSCLVNGDHSEISEIDNSKKKKKREKLSMDYETSEILEDSEDSHKAKKKKNKHKQIQNATSDDDNFQHDIENGQITSSTLIQDNYSIQENGSVHYKSDIQSVSTLESSTKTTNPESNKTEGPLKKTSRISDRIRFEEDSIDYEPKDVPKHDISIQLGHFISSNINLKPLQADLHRDPEISDDDEVWILKVPHDIAIGDLENTNLTLDSKKKVKINGNSYDTIIDTTVNAAPILLFNKRKVFIKNTPLKGVINLRKRIPKINISYESLMTNTESSFIPLPDTKCRHPLFGAHYKKAAKVPPGIAERLKPTTVLPNKKKKKHKVEIASDIEVKPDIEDHSSKKTKKLKHKLDIESDTQEKPHIEVWHSKKNKRRNKERVEIESESEVKPNLEVKHSKKQKRKSKDRLEVESVSEVQPSFKVLHSKKNKTKSKEKLESESDIEIKINSGALHSNKKKRKHSDESGASTKAKRVKCDPTSADAWESEQAIEKNLFDF